MVKNTLSLELPSTCCTGSSWQWILHARQWTLHCGLPQCMLEGSRQLPANLVMPCLPPKIRNTTSKDPTGVSQMQSSWSRTHSCRPGWQMLAMPGRRQLAPLGCQHAAWWSWCSRGSDTLLRLGATASTLQHWGGASWCHAGPAGSAVVLVQPRKAAACVITIKIIKAGQPLAAAQRCRLEALWSLCSRGCDGVPSLCLQHCMLRRHWVSAPRTAAMGAIAAAGAACETPTCPRSGKWPWVAANAHIDMLGCSCRYGKDGVNCCCRQ